MYVCSHHLQIHPDLLEFLQVDPLEFLESLLAAAFTIENNCTADCSRMSSSSDLAPVAYDSVDPEPLPANSPNGFTRNTYVSIYVRVYVRTYIRTYIVAACKSPRWTHKKF